MLCTICELVRAAHILILTLLSLKGENTKLHFCSHLRRFSLTNCTMKDANKNFVRIKQVAQYPPVCVYRLHVKFQGVLTSASEVTIDIVR